MRVGFRFPCKIMRQLLASFGMCSNNTELACSAFIVALKVSGLQMVL